jgi:hypothetical protein
MRVRKIPPQDVAHFLMKLMFSMFAEDIDLLPNRVFGRTLKQSKNVGSKLSAFLDSNRDPFPPFSPQSCCTITSLGAFSMTGAQP